MEKWIVDNFSFCGPNVAGKLEGNQAIYFNIKLFDYFGGQIVVVCLLICLFVNLVESCCLNFVVYLSGVGSSVHVEYGD